MIKLSGTVFIGFFLLLVGCSKPGLVIKEQQYGEKWPLTVSSGRVECENNSVTFHASGKKYAVNGVAKKNGYTPIDSIWKDDPDFFEMVEEVAKIEKISFDDALNVMGKPTKISISPILDSGLKLCK